MNILILHTCQLAGGSIDTYYLIIINLN